MMRQTLSETSFAESRTLAVTVDRTEMTGATDSQRRHEGNDDERRRLTHVGLRLVAWDLESGRAALAGRRPAHDPMVMELRSFVRLRSLRFFVVNPFSP